MSGEASLPHDPLDPVRIRADVAPASEIADVQRQRSLALIQAGLAVAILLCLVSLVVPIFVPLDLRPKGLPVINDDEVILYTDPPGAAITSDALANSGQPLGHSAQDPIRISQMTRDGQGQKLDNILLRFVMDGYRTHAQTVTDLELHGKVWPSTNQGPLRLTPANPWVYLSDYLPRYRPWLFSLLCLGSLATTALGLALVVRYRWLAARDRLRTKEKGRDNLTGISVLGFEIVERLGAGATSLVYRGVSDKDFKTERAVRFSRTAQITDKETDTFRREAGVYQKIDHPNVVKAFEFQRFENTFVIVMELIEGKSMDTLFGEGRPLAVDAALSIFSGIAAGLDHAHSRGVIHRDLKPANVMIRNDGTPAVVDFGMATDLDVTKITQTGVVKGTLAYIAPEQLTSPTGVGPAADQFAFGMMLYEALSGKLAYDANDPSRLLSDRLSGQAVPFQQVAPQFPAEVASAVMKMITVNPQNRFPTISEGMAVVRKALDKECKSV